MKAPTADFAAAMDARSERTVPNSEQGGRHAASNRRFTVQASNRQFPGSFVVGLLQRICASFDRDALQASRLGELSLLCP
jgi:hypothetical protein